MKNIENKNIKEKGITLIALVVTIIVLLILAAVSVNLVFGDNGILRKAKIGANDYSVSAAKEKIEIEIADLYAEKLNSGEEMTFSMIAQKLIEKGITAEGLADEDNKQIITLEGYIAKLINVGTNSWKVEMLDATSSGGLIIADGVTPRQDIIVAVRTIKLTAAELQNGIKKITFPDGSEKTYNGVKVVNESYEATDNGTYTFIVEDNKGEIREYSVEIENILEGIITIVPDEKTEGWAQKREIEVIWPEKTSTMTKEISIDDGNTYTEYTNKIEITSNEIIKARLTKDGRVLREAEQVEISNIDSIKPTIGNISVPGGTANTKTITISGIEDIGGSGLKGYYVVKDNSTQPTFNSAWTNNTESSFVKEVSENGTYYVWVIDNAGNISDVSSCIVSEIASKVTVTAFSYSETTIKVGSTSETPTKSITGEAKSGPIYSIVSGSEYATINSSTGVVTGVAPGTATVRITYINYDDTAATRTIDITIRNKITYTNFGNVTPTGIAPDFITDLTYKGGGGLTYNGLTGSGTWSSVGHMGISCEYVITSTYEGYSSQSSFPSTWDGWEQGGNTTSSGTCDYSIYNGKYAMCLGAASSSSNANWWNKMTITCSMGTATFCYRTYGSSLMEFRWQ